MRIIDPLRRPKVAVVMMKGDPDAAADVTSWHTAGRRHPPKFKCAVERQGVRVEVDTSQDHACH
jgi:hypothetical protein